MTTNETQDEMLRKNLAKLPAALMANLLVNGQFPDKYGDVVINTLETLVIRILNDEVFCVPATHAANEIMELFNVADDEDRKECFNSVRRIIQTSIDVAADGVVTENEELRSRMLETEEGGYAMRNKTIRECISIVESVGAFCTKKGTPATACRPECHESIAKKLGYLAGER